MKKQEIINLTIDSLAFEGYGVGRFNDFVYFVKGAIPGDNVEVRLLKKRKNYAFANVLNVVTPSQKRIEPPCEYFGECGGCSLQNLDYDEQLHWKTQFVKDALKKFANIDPNIVQHALECSNQFEYRNKMEFSFSAQRWLTKNEIRNDNKIINKNFALGLHTPENYLKVIDINQCHIQNNYANQILNFVRSEANRQLIEPYNTRTNMGFLKNLVIRHSVANNNFLVILITNSVEYDAETNFAIDLVNSLKKKFDNIIGAIWAINSTKSPVAKGEINFVKGEQYLYENILNVNYRISPFSFFQTNSYQLNPFIAKILEIANLNANQIVWDLYCGAGSITLPAAKLANQTYGFELVAESIIDAKYNAEINKIENATFRQIDLHSKTIMNEFINYPNPDVVILDPPRAGMHQNLVQTIMNLEPKEIVYVSCNPTTQARDLNIMKEKYNVVACQPVDMFPQTYHIENIVKLIKH